MTVIHALPPIVRANRGSLRQQAKRFIFGPPKPITPRDRDNPQAAALLLQRLPFEIRAQIWDNYFHSPATRLVHIRDYAITSAECVAEDWQDHSYRSHLKCHQLEQKRDRMSLLLTCKLIYFEAVHLLYSTTIFDFTWDFYLTSNFRKVIPYCHFASISSVNIVMICTSRSLYSRPDKYFKSSQEFQWGLIWESLAAMDGLQWLRFEVTLYSHLQNELTWTSNLERILHPVKLVTKPAYFELIMPFDIGDWARELPCQFTQSEARDALRSTNHTG